MIARKLLTDSISVVISHGLFYIRQIPAIVSTGLCMHMCTYVCVRVFRVYAAISQSVRTEIAIRRAVIDEGHRGSLNYYVAREMPG